MLIQKNFIRLARNIPALKHAGSIVGVKDAGWSRV